MYIDVDIDFQDVIDGCTKSEKLEMLEYLLDDLDLTSELYEDRVTKILGKYGLVIEGSSRLNTQQTLVEVELLAALDAIQKNHLQINIDDLTTIQNIAKRYL